LGTRQEQYVEDGSATHHLEQEYSEDQDILQQHEADFQVLAIQLAPELSNAEFWVNNTEFFAD